MQGFQGFSVLFPDNSTNQPVEAFECAVYHLQGLLSNVSIKQLIILVDFALVVIRFIA
jgi:hypothetical protein